METLRTKRQWAMMGFRIKPNQAPKKVSSCGYNGRTEYYSLDQCNVDFSAYIQEENRQRQMRRICDLRHRIYKVYLLSEFVVSRNQKQPNAPTIRRIRRNWNNIDISTVTDEGIIKLWYKTKIMVDSILK